MHFINVLGLNANYFMKREEQCMYNVWWKKLWKLLSRFHKTLNIFIETLHGVLTEHWMRWKPKTKNQNLPKPKILKFYLHYCNFINWFSTGSSKSLGSLNPELYRFPEEGDLSEYPENHIGRLWFSLEYDKDAEKLSVSLGKLRNLPSREMINNSNACDPFIRSVQIIFFRDKTT